MLPTWTRRDGLIQLTYDLPHRIHAAQIYPIRAPNGSSIIICGHENGLTVFWRGGRPFKQSLASTTTKNGMKQAKGQGPSTSDNNIMVIDSDDEAPPKQTQHDNVTDMKSFEDVEEEYDPSRPYEPIINTLDVPQLETAVLHFATPAAITPRHNHSSESRPSIVANRIIVVAACADSSIRLITIPFVPSQNSGSQQVQQFTITPHKNSLRSVPRGITATWTSQRSDGDKWSLLVASHNAEAGGKLYVYQCSLVSDGAQFGKESMKCLQQEYLPHPLRSICFSSAQLSSPRHTQILVLETQGTVRIYDPLPPNNMLSAHSGHDVDLDFSSKKGKWLASLQASSAILGHGSLSVSQRELSGRLLDARWAFNGKCVVALLADGEWGVWDIEGVAPIASDGTIPDSNDEPDRSSPVGTISHFALRGFVGDSVDARSAGFSMEDGTSLSSGNSKETTRHLAPMTPRTRKTKQDRLFTGPTRTSATQSSFANGGISLMNVLDESGSYTDESVIFWHANSLYALPSLMAYWQRVVASTRTNDVSTVSGPSIPTVNALSTTGELVTGVNQPSHVVLPKSTSTPLTNASKGTIQQDVLVSAEHRLIILSNGKKPRDHSSKSVNGRSKSLNHASTELEEDDMMRLDQDLLKRGELDIGGLDRMLDDLGAGSGSPTITRSHTTRQPAAFNASRRKVGFVHGS